MHHHKSTRVEGAMPCGNPKRYESRDVVRMPDSGPHGRKRKTGQVTDDHMETESEKHVQSLLQHQTKTDITLADQFSRHRTFTPATSHAPEVEKLVGVHDYKQYKEVDDLDAKIDYLRHCGLDDEEITLKLREEMKDKISSSVVGYGADPVSRQDKLREIERKIQEKEKSLQTPDTFKGALELSRQAMDLEKSLAQRQGKDSLLYALTIQKKFEVTHPDDPINHIPEILNGIDGKRERMPRRERRRRRKLEKKNRYYASLGPAADEDDRDNYAINDSSNDCVDDGLMGSAGSSSDTHSKQSRIGGGSEDKQSTTTDSCSVKNPGSKIHLASTHSQENQSAKNNDEIPSSSKAGHSSAAAVPSKEKSKSQESNNAAKTIKEMSQPIRFLSKEEIMQNKLTVEEIRAVDKFQNYIEGTPNKIVYVKNLPNKTTEEELASLFGSFQSHNKPDIMFRLLSGRMKGQAFITFPDETTAVEAIKLVNGYKLEDRPVILSFGKKQ